MARRDFLASLAFRAVTIHWFWLLAEEEAKPLALRREWAYEELREFDWSLRRSRRERQVCRTGLLVYLALKVYDKGVLFTEVKVVMIERVYIDNYRCFVNFECRFGSTHLLMGPNGSGKTTFLEVLTLLRSFSVLGSTGSESFLGTTQTRWLDLPEQKFELDVRGNGGVYTYRLVVDTWGSPGVPRVVREEVDFSGMPIFKFAQGEVHLFNDRHESKVQYPFDWRRSALATITERKENTKLTWFKRWFGNFLYVSPDPRAMSGVAVAEERIPDPHLENFANWFRHLRQESDDHALMDDLREAIEGLSSLDLKEAGMGNRVLTTSFASAGKSNGRARADSYTFRELSDGQRVLIALYTVLHFGLPTEATIAFDEPDNYIALREIQPWLEKLLDRLEDVPGGQVFIVSHHPELLNRLAAQEGLVFDRPGARHVRVRKFEDAAQTGLSVAELVARGWDRE